MSHATPQQALVSFDDVSFRYRASKDGFALSQLSFELRENKIYGLLGRNGAGKTTLLALLAAFMPATSGSVLVNGERVFENPAVTQLVNFVRTRRHFGARNVRIADYLSTCAAWHATWDWDYADELQEKFMFDPARKIRDLSTGQAAVVSVVAGLAARCPITIYDEAYQGMDAANRELFYAELLRDQADHPRITIFSTHVISEVEHLLEEVLILDDGRLLTFEASEDLAAQGFTITGPADRVATHTSGMRVLDTKILGSTTSVTCFGDLDPASAERIAADGLEIGRPSLQDLFIHLTGGDQHE